MVELPKQSTEMVCFPGWMAFHNLNTEIWDSVMSVDMDSKIKGSLGKGIVCYFEEMPLKYFIDQWLYIFFLPMRFSLYY